MDIDCTERHDAPAERGERLERAGFQDERFVAHYSAAVPRKMAEEDAVADAGR